MHEPYYRAPPATDGTHEQWSLVRESDGENVRYDKVTPAVHLSGAPLVKMLDAVPVG
jgi:hypothetical protein